MKTSLVKVFFSALIALVGVTVSAHGLATTESEIVGKYLVKLEYENLDVINSGEATAFSFELLDSKTEESAEFDRVYVQVSKKVGDYPVVFVSNLVPVSRLGDKSAGATIFLPVEGDYYFKLAYYSNNIFLVEKTFDIKVGPSQQDSNSSSTSKYLWAVSLIVGMIGGVVLGKKL
jgi:hypothetical protein